MSKALDYLLAARPEAMQSYFRFLRQAGTHLDPRTRAIISVITKVDNRTETGFRQYLRRALEQGVTPNEILDALLLAFPTLGLSKIIWAVDLLLEMDLPEFSLERLAGEETWHDLADVGSLAPDAARCIEADGRCVFVYHSTDGFRVYDEICPHQGTRIPPEALRGYELTCPRHAWGFDLRSGECIRKGDRPLRQFTVRIQDNTLQARW